MNENFDLIIAGGGPAGTAAAVYAARKQLKTLLIVKEFGGQSSVSEDIRNWIGTPSISGIQLAENFKEHAKAYEGEFLAIREGEYLTKIKKEGNTIVVTTNTQEYRSSSLLIATGSSRRKIEARGADTFEHKGLTYCASCDGPVFSGMDVVVLGGGNAGFETAAQLLAYCKTVTLINRTETFRADPITVEKILKHPNMRVIKNAEVIQIMGSTMVSTLVYKDIITKKNIVLPTSGIFVEIGQIPNTDFARGVVPMTPYNQIIIDPRTQKTQIPGIWAAGDCTDVLYHQNNIAAGDAVRALEDIYLALKAK